MSAKRTGTLAALTALAAVMAVLLAACGGDSDDGPVTAFPSPGTTVANPETQISFRGASADDLDGIEVRGSRSGVHDGELVEHSDGEGASFMPSEPFEQDERVTVSTDLDVEGAQDGGYAFDTFVSGRATVPPGGLPPEPAGEEVTAGEARDSDFISRPDLNPPPVSVNVKPKEGASDSEIFLAPKNDGLMILDPEGDLVWYKPGVFADFRVQEYRDEPVMTWWTGDFSTILAGFANGRFEIVGEDYEPIVTVQAGNGYQGNLHEFDLTDRDTAYVSIYEPVRTDMSEVGGPQDGVVMDSVIQEVDPETGAVLFEWHSLDHVGVEESKLDPTPGSSFDYFHINSIKEDDDGDLLVSARNTSTVYKVDRDTGEVIWRLGGERSDFDLDEETTFHFQHDAQRNSEGYITLFDNSAFMPGPEGAIRDRSRGLVLDVDEDEMTAEVVREYEHEGYLSPTQGNVEELPNGNVMVGWGSTPAFTEFSKEGEVLFDAGVTARNSSYRVYRHDWVGTPRTKPDVALEGGGDGPATGLAVSWNGSTEVAAWQLLSGDSAGALEPVGDPVEKTGFETVIEPAEELGELVAVEALDEDGEALSRSNPTSTTPK